MLRRTVTIGLVLSILLIALATLPGQRAFALTPTQSPTPCGVSLTITGKVSNAANGLAIAGATVIADTSVSHPFATTTAADGTYTLSIPVASNYACLVNGLRVTAAGYNEASRVINSASLRTQSVQNFSLSAGSGTITPTRTPAPGCGTRVVVTSTPSPTFTPTPRTATATPTTCAPIYITATPGGSVNLPDLTVLSITEFAYTVATPTADVLGCWRTDTSGRTGLRVTVQNNGAAAAGAFVVDLNGNQQSVAGLAAGQTLTVDFTYFGQTLPRSRVATADVTGVIAESDETNNAYSLILSAATSTSTGTAHPQICNTYTPTPSVTVTTLANGPDLVVSSITYVGSSPACINAPKDNLVISNIGNADAGAFVLSINGGSTPVSGLAAGQSITFVSSAMSSITVTIDSTNLIAETNENNNTLSVNLPVPTQAFTCTPNGPILTPTITPTFTRTITKTPTCAAPTAERLLVSPLTSPSTATSQVITVTLGHGQSVYVVSEAGSFTATGPVNGVFTVTVNLVPNSVNHLQVQGVVSYSSVCPPYSLFTTVDSSGNPLNIVQGTVSNTPTPTRTPTISPTPTTGIACSPLTGTISAPFTQDGVGSFCWQTTNMGGYINSWNLLGLTINGVNFTNAYVPSGSYPAKVNGYWYIRYTGNFAWSHFEAK